jgi:hypothetical protein
MFELSIASKCLYEIPVLTEKNSDHSYRLALGHSLLCLLSAFLHSGKDLHLVVVDTVVVAAVVDTVVALAVVDMVVVVDMAAVVVVDMAAVVVADMAN